VVEAREAEAAEEGESMWEEEEEEGEGEG